MNSMKNVEIKFNADSKKWEGLVNGSMVCKSKNKDYIGRRLEELGYNVPASACAVEDEAPVNPAVSEFSINERFEFVEKFVRMVGKGISNSLIIAGPGGLGKSFTVNQTLEKMGKKEMGIGDEKGDFVVIKGFTTAKGMYRTLWENNGKIIIFDDADSSFKDPIGANILKGALDSNDKRIISWNAEFSDREELPNRFEFVGRVIFISNLPINKIPQALVSRSLKCDVTMSMDEKIARIEHIMLQPSFLPNYGKEVKADVIEFMKENKSKFTDLNFRTAISVAKVRYHDDDGSWKRLALYMAVA
jgi:hypothetical protein